MCKLFDLLAEFYNDFSFNSRTYLITYYWSQRIFDRIISRIRFPFCRIIPKRIIVHLIPDLYLTNKGSDSPQPMYTLAYILKRCLSVGFVLESF